MGEHDLRHLAVIVGTDPDQTEDLASAVLASCGKAEEIARAAFVLVPGLQAFSWLDPGLDSLLARATGPATANACAAGARALARVAEDLDVSLRLCGRTEDLPATVFDRPARTDDGRTLLWFQRYSGRDEIVRAAGRFLAAHPGRRLADDDLDAWLDTAGIPDPDLLLYVGGALEPRDVLLWQGSYAEIGYAPGPVTGFSATDLRRAVADYDERQRRFGR